VKRYWGLKPHVLLGGRIGSYYRAYTIMGIFTKSHSEHEAGHTQWGVHQAAQLFRIAITRLEESFFALTDRFRNNHHVGALQSGHFFSFICFFWAFHGQGSRTTSHIPCVSTYLLPSSSSVFTETRCLGWCTDRSGSVLGTLEECLGAILLETLVDCLKGRS